MPHPSATAAAASLASIVNDLVETYKDAFTAADHHQVPFAAMATANCWPDIDHIRLSAAILDRANPAPHLAAGFYAQANPRLPSMISRANIWFGDNLWCDSGLPPMSVEYVAGRLTADLVATATARWRRIHQQLSTAYWDQRPAKAGLITVRRSPGARARRVRVEDLVAADNTHASAQDMIINSTDTRMLTHGGARRRHARAARLRLGLSQREVAPGFNYAQWENPHTADGPNGFPTPSAGFGHAWPGIARQLQLNATLTDGPTIDQVLSPVGHRRHQGADALS
ncbi:MAG: hypothetical protein ACOH1Y_18400 [Propionicimonas sp.]